MFWLAWKTRKFFALTLIPSSSSSLRYLWLLTASPSILWSLLDPMMDRVNFFSLPSSISKMAVTEARLDTGREMEAPWIRSESLRTRSDDVFSPMTKEMASMKLDLPDPFGPMTATKEESGPRRL